MRKILTSVKNLFLGKIYNYEDYRKTSEELLSQLKKYEETYKLLGEYDKKSIEDPTILAKPGRLQIYTSRVQGSFN